MRAFAASATPAFQLDEAGVISWREARVGRLVKGDGLYAPRPEVIDSDLLSIDQTQRLHARLNDFVAEHVRDVLSRLLALESPEAIEMPAPGKAAPGKAVPDTATVPTDDAGGPTRDEIPANPPVEQPDILEEPVTKPITLSGAAKGIAFTLFEGLGAVRSVEIAHLTKALEDLTARRWRVLACALALRRFICRIC